MFSLGNGVTVALQTLTLPVGVRIPVPQPKTTTRQSAGCCFLLEIESDENPNGVRRRSRCGAIAEAAAKVSSTAILPFTARSRRRNAERRVSLFQKDKSKTRQSAGCCFLLEIESDENPG